MKLHFYLDIFQLSSRGPVNYVQKLSLKLFSDGVLLSIEVYNFIIIVCNRLYNVVIYSTT